MCKLDMRAIFVAMILCWKVGPRRLFAARNCSLEIADGACLGCFMSVVGI